MYFVCRITIPVPYPVSLLLAGFGHLLHSLLCSSSSSIQKAVTEPLPGVRCWIKHLQSVSKTHSLYMTSSTLNQMIGKLSCFSLERVQHSVFLNDHEQVLFPQQLHGQGVMEGLVGWRPGDVFTLLSVGMVVPIGIWRFLLGAIVFRRTTYSWSCDWALVVTQC